jgi:uncharacterized membrane protein required for colicin V production
MSAPVIVALLVIAGFAVAGYRAGVVRRLLEIVGLVATIVVASRLASSVTPALVERSSLDEEAVLWLAWLALVVVGIVITFVVARGLSRLVRLTLLGTLDRWGGAVCGGAIGLLLVSIVLVAISQVAGGESVQTTFERSAIGRVIFNAAPTVYVEGRRLVGRDGDDLWERVGAAARRESERAADKARELADELSAELSEGDGD